LKITAEEESMLSGKQGEAARLSMEILVRIGSVYGAKRLVPVKSVHAGCAYPEFSASVDMMERYASLGGKFRTIPTINPLLNPDNFDRWGEFQESETKKKATIRQIDAIKRIGAIPDWSCVPYFEGNLPRMNEPISWVESSAVIFVNSVLGARTNRTAMGVDIASAITGRVPEFGFLLKEERAGNALVNLEFIPRGLFDFNTLGYILGKICNGKIPVIQGMPSYTTANELKVMGAAAATRGGIALFHAIGITPEARSRADAFQRRKPEFEVSITERDMKSAVEEMTTFKSGGIDGVAVGCPHPSVDEVAELATLLNGKKVRKNIWFCLFASSKTVNLTRKIGFIQTIENSGVKVFEGDCMVAHSVKSWGWKNIATNSAKYACTLSSAPSNLGVIYADIKECVRLATG
jgi:predicted aconitase